VIEDMGAIEDCAAANFRLRFQKRENAFASINVKVGRDLIHQVYWAVWDQDFQKLTTSSLTIRNLVDFPGQVNLQHIGKVATPSSLTLLLTNEVADGSVYEELSVPPISAVHDLSSYGWIIEAILAKNLSITSWNHPLPAKDGHHCGLASAISTDNKNARSSVECKGHAIETTSAACI
jgi:hypothetical protein